MNENKAKKYNAKNVIINLVGFLAVFAFLGIGIILILLGAHVITDKINKGGSIASYFFGVVFLLIFIFIVAKVIQILLMENKYEKQAIDTEKLFADYKLNEDENKVHMLFQKEYEKYAFQRDTYFGFLDWFERKTFKRQNINISSPQIRALIEGMIIETVREYQIFDVYLAIDFTKSSNRKLIWKGDVKKYKIYFEYIRDILHYANKYVKENFIFKSNPLKQSK
ncbi:hypothetical protein R9B83_00530 [Metamycoplasma equirhinis]|uniref:Phage abortive infection protein n=1 Tax=Metamycoplasma equirhinis TaxID=92402 RepID=A0ABZ0PAX1_9BACT|nr:hypothetical protein [Metamycoplasma equirhinis]TPD98883.1 hypothetical protein FJM08_01440 [Metamycoplasma equirhinis]WPB54050.1 hypothetical protein R9B83_00530 [Metamycoplasma equirhinis]